MRKKSTKDIPAICGVNLERYLGKWYEVARFPHTFERGLQNVTATYSLQSNGKIKVINAGYRGSVKSLAEGYAWIPDKNCTGELLVSFFWPIRSKYRIIKLDKENYRYAVVTSNSKNYLWILCRDPHISESIYKELVNFISANGFDKSKIIRVSQE